MTFSAISCQLIYISQSFLTIHKIEDYFFIQANETSGAGLLNRLTAAFKVKARVKKRGLDEKCNLNIVVKNTEPITSVVLVTRHKNNSKASYQPTA